MKFRKGDSELKDAQKSHELPICSERNKKSGVFLKRTTSNKRKSVITCGVSLLRFFESRHFNCAKSNDARFSTRLFIATSSTIATEIQL